MEHLIKPRKIAFLFDQVRHFHVPLFEQLEERLKSRNCELILLRGTEHAANARGSTARQVVANERTFRLRDFRVGTYTIRLACGYIPFLRELRPDVVVCPAHPGDVGHWRLIQSKKALGFRLVAWQCGFEYNPGRAKDWLLHHFVPGFDFHLAYHSNARAYAVRYGAREEQILVTHNTVDESRFEVIGKEAARSIVGQRHPEVAGKKILLYVGAVLDEKRIEWLVEAMDHLNRQDLVLMVVGDGPHLDDLKKKASGRTDVVFAGQVIEGVGVYFDAAEMYVLPGTGGLGINEAMAHSLPVVASYADGSADDLVVDGMNGFRLRKGGAVEIAEKVGVLLDDASLSEKMGQCSREWITGKFSFKNFVDRVESGLLTCARLI